MNGSITANNELESMWKEVGAVYFTVKSHHLLNGLG
jgi:hypothetical protein